jgi:hypothetical protein
MITQNHYQTAFTEEAPFYDNIVVHTEPLFGNVGHHYQISQSIILNT